MVKIYLKEDVVSLQKKLLYLRRNMDMISKHFFDIIVEGLDYYPPCNFKSFESFYNKLLEDSVITLINSYEQLEGTKDKDEVFKYIYDYGLTKYHNFMIREWDERECD